MRAVIFELPRLGEAQDFDALLSHLALGLDFVKTASLERG
jgi:hypothetical protein